MSVELELALSQKKPKDDRWKKGPRLSKDSLTNAKLVDDNCQHFGRRKIKQVEVGTDMDAQISPVISFGGKYKGRTYEWVYKNDCQYHNWACENIKDYERRAAATIKK